MACWPRCIITKIPLAGMVHLAYCSPVLPYIVYVCPEAEFKEFEPWLKYGWFRLKLYLMFQDLSRR